MSEMLDSMADDAKKSHAKSNEKRILDAALSKADEKWYWNSEKSKALNHEEIWEYSLFKKQ